MLLQADAEDQLLQAQAAAQPVTISLSSGFSLNCLSLSLFSGVTASSIAKMVAGNPSLITQPVCYV